MIMGTGRNYGNVYPLESVVLFGENYGYEGITLTGTLDVPGPPPVIPDTMGSLNQCIRRYVAMITGLDPDTHVIKAFQPLGPIPKTGLFSTILIMPVDSVGIDAISYKDDVGINIIESRCGVREFMASVNFYRENSMNNAYALKGSECESKSIEYFSDCGIGSIRTGPIRDLSDIQLAKYEERAQMDMFFTVIAENENTVSSIQSQEVDGTFESDGKTYNNIIEVTQ